MGTFTGGQTAYIFDEDETQMQILITILMFRPSDKEQTKGDKQTVDTMYNQWVTNNKKKVSVVSNEEFEKIESKYRINEIGNKQH